MNFTKSEFIRFHAAIMEKFRERCVENNITVPTEIGEIYGFKKNYVGHSLAKDVSDYPPVKEYLGPTSSIIHLKMLYEKNNSVEKKNLESISLDDFYTGVFLRYLGYIDEDDFREKNFPVINEIVKYKALFYSFRLHEVRDFSLEINYGTNPFKVREKGLHFHEHKMDAIPNSDNLPIYEGVAKHDRSYLHIDLSYMHIDPITQDVKHHDEMKVLAYVGNFWPKELKFMACSFQVVSRFGYPLAAAAIMVREEACTENVRMEISRYLMFKRSIFRIPPRIIMDTADLKIKGNDLDDLGESVGIYRVWNFFGERSVMQSKFIIDKNYQAFFETDTYGEKSNKQTCLLDLTNILDKRKICLSSHPTKGVNTIAYIIMDIPSRDKRITKGVFCSVGRRGREPAAGHIVMYREDDGKFDVGELSAEKVEELVKKDKTLGRLYKTLVESTGGKKDILASKPK